MSVGQAYAAYYRDHMTDKEKRRQEEYNRQRKLKTFHVVLIGDRHTGISSLNIRFTCGDFGYDPYESSTLRYIEFSRDVEVDDSPWLLTAPYTCGSYDYESYWDEDPSPYVKRMCLFGRCAELPHGVLLVYDTTKKETFLTMKDKLFPWLKKFLTDELKWPSLPIVVVGTKCDLTDEREVSYKTAKKFADENNLAVFETSAKEDINVELAYMTLVAMMKERRENGEDKVVQENNGKTLDKRTKCSLQ